jgi:hypothetical protein
MTVMRQAISFGTGDFQPDGGAQISLWLGGQRQRASGLIVVERIYAAWPVYHMLGKRHMATFATDLPGGFNNPHIAGLLKLLPALALVSDIVSRIGWRECCSKRRGHLLHRRVN